MNPKKTTSIVLGAFLFLLPFIFDISPVAVSILCMAAGVRILASVWITKRDVWFYIVYGLCLVAIVVAIVLLILGR